MRINLLPWRTLVASAFLTLLSSSGAGAAPPIRADSSNRVPACVTPERLMTFLAARNGGLDPRYRGIAEFYRRHGEVWRVRWDYAFFQMALETNFLAYRRGDGRRGDVSPRQNNFAGLGATGGGVPGDSYPDVSTGVLAQIQHLVAYSGERLERPVGARTQLKQDDIIAVSLRLGRPVTFADLTNRWAADRRYHHSIEVIAEEFRAAFCDGEKSTGPVVGPAPVPVPASRAGRAIASYAAPAAVTSSPKACRITTATYGGAAAVLIRSEAAGTVHYTALGVLEGFERSMTQSFLAAHAHGGRVIGTFASREAALAKADELCANQ